jgi:aminopeptidase YwaD
MLPRALIRPSALATLLLPLALACGAPAAAARTAPAAPPILAQQAPAAAAPVFSGRSALEHVTRLAETIGSRPAGTPASTAAADYIAGRLGEYGYQVERQRFTFPNFVDTQSDLLAGEESVAAGAMLYSASGDVSGPLVFAGYGRQGDLPGRLDGAVALVERGAQVTFRDKVATVTGAGAAAVVIYNSAQVEFTGTLQVPSDIPVLAISGADGRRLRQRLAAGPLDVRVAVDATVADQPAENVVASRAVSPGAAGPAPGGTVVVGAHFDSIPAGPGANDNASGTALLLELARVLAADPQAAPGLDVVFVAFDAEEMGLLGSAQYVASLPPEDRARGRAMLNFDMVGVGDALRVGGDPTLVRIASEVARGRGESLGPLPEELGRASDHASFVAAGIPGVFFHVTDDPNYHTAGDVVAHVSPDRLQQMGDIGVGVLRRLAAS